MSTDPRQVKRAEVRKAGRPAATLARSGDGGVTFAYLPAYDGPVVATTLPVGSAQTRSGGAVPPFFAGLLPEGRRLGALTRAVKTSADDELSLLLAVGGDTIGDVQVVPGGEPSSPVEPQVVIDPGRPVRFRDVLRAMDIHPDRTGLPGVQDKTSAAMISLPATRADDRFLLKLDPPEYPGLVENEAFFLAAGLASGVRTAYAEVVRDVDDVPGLLVLRFDRQTGTPSRLAVEDGCQVLDRYPADKYLVGYAAAFGALAAVCDARLLAARTLVAQLAYAYVTGNGDAHAKNFSVLQAPDGEWRVSPAYDVPSTQPYGDSTTAMPVNGRTRDLGSGDLLVLGAELGVPGRAVERVLREVCDGVGTWLDRLVELPFDLRRVHKLRRVVEQRRARIQPGQR